MTEPLPQPKRKNPLRRTQLPLPPPMARSRSAHLLTQAAAEGRFALPGCAACGAVHYPPRDACPKCLSALIGLVDASPLGRVAAATSVRVSTDPYFRERLPWRVGTVVLDAGPVVIAHLHGDVDEGHRVRLSFKLDKGGQAAAIALPEKETPHMSDDRQLRELTLDPKFRRVLVTDARSAVGQATVAAFVKAGAAIVFAGVADPWKPFPERDSLARLEGVEIVTLDVRDGESLVAVAGGIGAKIDILVNTAEHVRPGGLLARKGVAVAQEEMETGYLGLMRLAHAFGPTMMFRGADGPNSACAWVNVLSVYALMPVPEFGAFSAAQAAVLSGSLSLRSEFRASGVRVLNVFSGPVETEWFQAVPPPKVAPAQIASAIVAALKSGQEDVYVGDVAEDTRARLASNPKALERELGH
jgi:NAD(P)-dependent dehydrogenase (short-subunit alcohol dehydrogenase family)/uncharacterized OB-fold protein